MIDTSILPLNILKLMTFATILGLVVMGTVAICTLVATLWGATWLLGLFLAHTSSTQLLLIIIITYGGYRIGKGATRTKEVRV